jgi:hypothetical protein
VHAANGVIPRKFGGQHVGIFVDQDRIVVFIGVGVAVTKNIGRAAGQTEEGRPD